MCWSKLYFHYHVNFISSYALKLLGSFTSYQFIFLPWIALRFYVTLIRSKLQNASVAWNTLTLADPNKLEIIQNKLANLCYSRFDRFRFSRKHDLILECLKFRTLYSRRQYLDGLYLFKILEGKIDCHSIMNTVSLRILTKLIRDFSMLTVSNSVTFSPSARCVNAANRICQFLDVCNRSTVSLEDKFSLYNSG
jgi:hypothetical protein